MYQLTILNIRMERKTLSKLINRTLTKLIPRTGSGPMVQHLPNMVQSHGCEPQHLKKMKQTPLLVLDGSGEW